MTASDVSTEGKLHRTLIPWERLSCLVATMTGRSTYKIGEAQSASEAQRAQECKTCLGHGVEAQTCHVCRGQGSGDRYCQECIGLDGVPQDVIRCRRICGSCRGTGSADSRRMMPTMQANRSYGDSNPRRTKPNATSSRLR